jgi:hypothetical protein
MIPAQERYPMRRWILALVVSLWCAGRASAVLLYSSSDRNFDPPGSLTNRADSTGPAGMDDPRHLLNSGWQYQGLFAGTFMATAIDPTHVIAAHHTVPDAFTTNTFVYSNLAGQTITYSLNNRHNIPNTDLDVWSVAGDSVDHWAPLWNPGVDGSEVGHDLVVFGRGRMRGAEVRDPATGALKGWQWGAADGRISWGQNVVSSIQDLFSDGDQGALAFSFDADGGPNEAGLSEFDSSGGVFIQASDGKWKLAGLNYGVFSQWHVNNNGTPGPLISATLFDPVGMWLDGSPPTLITASDPNLELYHSEFASRIGASYSSIISTLGAVPPPSPIPEPTAFIGAIAAIGAWSLKRPRRILTAAPAGISRR